MTVKELEELFLRRQSCRAFSDRKVTKEQIERICALASLAPSACNLQPWKVYALTGGKLPAAKELLLNAGKAPFVADVPALLVIAEDPREAKAKAPNLPYYTPGDVGEFTAHLLLAAEASGLSSCLLGWQNRPGFSDLLGIPGELSVPFVVALGYAADGYEIRPKNRRPLSDTLLFAD